LTAEIKYYQKYPRILFQFLTSLYPAKLNEKHAKAMNRLTHALLVVAAIEAVATLVSVLIAAGFI
jgi:hypothetical protein